MVHNDFLEVLLFFDNLGEYRPLACCSAILLVHATVSCQGNVILFFDLKKKVWRKRRNSSTCWVLVSPLFNNGTSMTKLVDCTVLPSTLAYNVMCWSEGPTDCRLCYVRYCAVVLWRSVTQDVCKAAIDETTRNEGIVVNSFGLCRWLWLCSFCHVLW